MHRVFTLCAPRGAALALALALAPGCALHAPARGSTQPPYCPPSGRRLFHAPKAPTPSEVDFDRLGGLEPAEAKLLATYRGALSQGAARNRGLLHHHRAHYPACVRTDGEPFD